jgi:ribA/ribD-fused uncharacterized protein
MDEINSFRGEYRFLSNFYPSYVMYEGLEYPSVEHAYQASKTDNPEIRKQIYWMQTPGEAKRAGQTIHRNPEHEIDRVKIMEQLLRAKFTPTIFRLRLEKTKGFNLIEGNTWHDNFWGACVCEACKDKEKHNHLGRLLMKIRDE